MATKEERFILKLYKKTQEKGDPTIRLDRYDIGRDLGLNSKSVDGICATLFQANFIRKEGNSNIFLTSNGIDLAKNLLGEFD